MGKFRSEAMSVSPLRGYDGARDKERDSVQGLSHNATQYAKEAELGELMTEMLTATILAKPDKPLDFLIDLLSATPAKRYAVCAPPAVPLEAAVKAVSDQEGVIAVSLPPLLDEAKERIIDGKTVEEHGADGATVPDHIVVKLVAERLSKPDCAEKGWVLENIPSTKGQAQRLVAHGFLPDKLLLLNAPDDVIVKQTLEEDQRAGLPEEIARYRKNMTEVTPMFAATMQQFECSGPGEVDAVLPFIKRSLEKKKGVDPGLSKNPGNQ